MVRDAVECRATIQNQPWVWETALGTTETDCWIRKHLDEIEEVPWVLSFAHTRKQAALIMSDKLKRASRRGLSGWWGCPTASLGFGDMANFRVQNGWVLCLTWVCFWYVVCRTGQNEVDGKIERKEGGQWRRGERGKKTRWKGRKGREGGEKGVRGVKEGKSLSWPWTKH